MTSKIYPFVPARPAVSEACKWSAAMESIALSNMRIWLAWQRVILRAVTGV